MKNVIKFKESEKNEKLTKYDGLRQAVIRNYVKSMEENRKPKQAKRDKLLSEVC